MPNLRLDDKHVEVVIDFLKQKTALKPAAEVDLN